MADAIKIPWFHYFANAGMRLAFAVLLKLDLKGLEHVPRTGPLILAINHTNFLDPVLPGVYVRPDVLPMAKVEVFSPPFGWVYWGYGAFPVRRGEADLAALKHALKILREGHVMLISPEGTRSKEGTLQNAHEGAALIALKSGAPILPVSMWGGKKFWHNIKRLRRTPVGMRVGEPLVVAPLAGKPSREELRAITDELMYHIATLLPPEYRGAYAGLEKFQPRYLRPQRELPSQPNKMVRKEVAPMTQ